MTKLALSCSRLCNTFFNNTYILQEEIHLNYFGYGWVCVFVMIHKHCFYMFIYPCLHTESICSQVLSFYLLIEIILLQLTLKKIQVFIGGVLRYCL